MQSIRWRSRAICAMALIAGLAWSSQAMADEHIRGVVMARADDGTLTVSTDDSPSVIVVLSDYTKVRRTDGVRQLRVSSTSLIPGLRIDVYGSFEGLNRFAANKIEFSRTDLKMAKAIRGGIDPTDQRSLENQKHIAENTRLIEQQQQTLARQAQQIAENSSQIQANDQKMVATTGALATRIGNLDDYRVIETVTVYFRNNSAAIARQYKKQLEALAARAKGVNGYAIQVQGYASAVGPDKLNQRLSAERADAVTAILQQSGVTLTNVVVPATMGTTGQVASNRTAKGQAENRRTVVTLLQNKGLSER